MVPWPELALRYNRSVRRARRRMILSRMLTTATILTSGFGVAALLAVIVGG